MSHATTGVEPALRRDLSLGATETIRSPEQVALDLPIAGPMSRLLAFSVDYGVILIAEIFAFIALLSAGLLLTDMGEVLPWLEDAQAEIEQGQVPSMPWLALSMAVWIAIEFVFQWVYFVAFEVLAQGRSLGKAMFGLRVVREGGLPVTLRESMVRNLLRAVDMLPTGYLVGFVSMVVSDKTRRLGDIAAGTIVVRDHKSEPVRPIEIDAEPGRGLRSFRFDGEQLAAIGPVEQRLIRQTLRRVDELPAGERARVMRRTVDALRTRMDYPEAIDEAEWRGFLVAILRDTQGR